MAYTFSHFFYWSLKVVILYIERDYIDGLKVSKKC